MQAADRTHPPPSGIRSPRFVPRRSRSRSAPGGTWPRMALPDRARCCRGNRSPAAAFPARGGGAPWSSRRPAAAPAPGASLDDLVGAGEDRGRHRQAQRLGGLEIDDQLEGRRLLDRKIGGLGTFEDPPDIIAGQVIGCRKGHPVADQASVCDVFSPIVDRRNAVAQSQGYNLLAPAVEEGVADEERVNTLNESGKDRVDLAVRARLKDFEP